MKFKVTIELGNDAMQTEGDVAEVLSYVAGFLETKRVRLESEDGTYPSGALRDRNGNKVGEWEVTP